MINSDMFHNFEHYMYRDICYNILCLYYICMRVCVWYYYQSVIHTTILL